MRLLYQTHLILVVWLLLLTKYLKYGVLSVSASNHTNESDVFGTVGTTSDINKSWNVTTTEFYSSAGNNESIKLSEKLDIGLTESGDIISGFVTPTEEINNVVNKEAEKHGCVNGSECDKTEAFAHRNFEDGNNFNFSLLSEYTQENLVPRIYLPTRKISNVNTSTSNAQVTKVMKRTLAQLSISNSSENSNYFTTTLLRSPTMTNGSDLNQINAAWNKSSQYIPKRSNSSTSSIENNENNFKEDNKQINMSYILTSLPNINYSSPIYTGNYFGEDDKQVNVELSTNHNKVILENMTSMPEILDNRFELEHANRKHQRKQKHIHSKIPKRVIRGNSSPRNVHHGIIFVQDILDHRGGFAQNDEAAFGRGNGETDTSFERESLQNTKDILRQWLESSIIDLSHGQDESHENEEIVYDDHHSHEWHNDYDIIDEIFNQDWFVNSDELNDWRHSEESEYFACVSSELWEHFVSFGHHVYKGCEFTSEIERSLAAFRWRRFISRAPSGRRVSNLNTANCRKGTRRIKRVCKKVWFS